MSRWIYFVVKQFPYSYTTSEHHSILPYLIVMLRGLIVAVMLTAVIIPLTDHAANPLSENLMYRGSLLLTSINRHVLSLAPRRTCILLWSSITFDCRPNVHRAICSYHHRYHFNCFKGASACVIFYTLLIIRDVQVS